MANKKVPLQPDYLFEVSWEVCNKVGGIYTVVATKALHLSAQMGRHHIFIGPDVWMHRAGNPDFLEDPMLYRSWKAQAATEGLRLRIGRWNIPGKPLAILVDYKQFLPKADDILGGMWTDWGVDSISGNWDYKESAVFGIAAGRTIESFWNYNLKGGEKVVAQFHEWQTGAGILHLKKSAIPVATAFTTHATMMGRCLAGNNLPLYGALSSYNGDEMAARFNVKAIYSLEKKSAENADVFTTVSEITAKECAQFLRPVDVVTPNGFENSFTPASDEEYKALHDSARERLVQVATAMSAEEVPADALFLCISGRYEYRNKGIDVFIDALDRLNRSQEAAGRSVHAFIMIPSGHHGADKALAAKLSGEGDSHYQTQVSHYLQNAEYDTITRRLRETGLNNALGDKVKVYFIPSYLNGDDGVFNLPYYTLLCGMDLALFPSYYEPWGYTPLEALAFRVPTLTTSLAGFGKWVQTHYKGEHPGITVLERDDDNYSEVVDGVVARIREMASVDKDRRDVYRENAREVAQIALWEHQIVYYQEAYALALAKVQQNAASYKSKKDKTMQYFKPDVTSPSWRSILVTRHLPEKLSRLEKLSRNLWWCWNENAKDLFRSIDPEVWHKCGHNPLAVLDTVSIKRFQQLSEDADFLNRMKGVLDEFDAYMAAKAQRKDPSVAYFCMEYGLDTSLKIYSGGLGILAGDYLKETSDMNVNLVAVGLLYRYGYFNQVISAQGYQVAGYDAQDFTRIPATPVLDKDGNWVTTSVAFPGRSITARLWKVEVGRTDLYLMDADYEANRQEDREVTYHLYGGNWENRLKQELLLGVGGIRALRKLGLNPQVYHCNEGHAAFIGLERLREYIEKDNLDFNEALEVVRASSLFTTHTPVPAGHDAFEEGMLRQYIGHYPERLKVDWETLMSLGKDNPLDVHEKFSMSNLAANISQNVNGVSMLHGKVSQDIFAHMYPGYLPEELFVSYVTNGVHYPTWTAPEWKPVHARVFGPAFATHHYDKRCFDGIYGVSDAEVWDVKKTLKTKLMQFVRERLRDKTCSNHYSPTELVTISETLRDDVLTIGFARRFATYKRATLLFRDLDRLDKIVNNPQQPVQFLFAGKAHPADKAGQDLIKQIVDISKNPRFIGKIVFVPGYDITLAKRMVQGVDVWMNNPTRPQEASGTSGEKAAMNGTMHFSVLDGWWVEGYQEGAGWALPIEQAYEDNNFQNELDAATIYQILENDIAPAFYNVDRTTGRSAEWIGYIKNTIARVASNFTTNRMLTDYMNQYYDPQSKAVEAVKAHNFEQARELAAWKSHVRREWENVRVVALSDPAASYDLTVAKPYHAELTLQLGDLTPEEVGVEVVFAQTDAHGKVHIVEAKDFDVVEFKDGVAKYVVEVLPEKTGAYMVGGRIFAKHPLLPHRQAFECVKWV